MAKGFLNSLTGMMGIEDSNVKLISDFVYKVYHVIVTSKSQNVLTVLVLNFFLFQCGIAATVQASYFKERVPCI